MSDAQTETQPQSETQTETQAQAQTPEPPPEPPREEPPRKDAPEETAPAPGTLREKLSPGAMDRLAGGAAAGEGRPNLDLIMRIPVSLQVVLGEARMPIEELMKLGPKSVVALDRQVGEPIDVMVNGRLVARGEVVLMEDDSSRFGISLTEIVEPGGEMC